MDPTFGDAGRLLYEERAALLPGLWMPPAPAWEELSEEERERWRGYAAAERFDDDSAELDDDRADPADGSAAEDPAEKE